MRKKFVAARRSALLAKCMAALVMMLGAGALSAEIVLQGRVSALDPVAAKLDVAGVRVVATNAAMLSETDAAISVVDFKVGDRVEVRGVIAAAAAPVLSASRVQRTLADGDRLKGRVERSDAANRVFLIGGITVKVPVNARVEDAQLRALPIEQCSTNHVLSCSGTWTGTNEFTATAITAN